MTYLKSLSDAEDDRDTTFNGSLGLAGNELCGWLAFALWEGVGSAGSEGNCGDTNLISLLEDDTTLAVTDDSPVDLSILELLNTDLSGEGTVGLVVDVLGSNTDLRVGELAGQGEVEGGGRDDDLSGLIELGGIEVVHDVGDALGNTVPARSQLHGLCRYISARMEG